ncbi:MAG TPA: hypothetical protein VEZ50_05465 [Nodosilinea sp.]|nr:hypothetical protein [Nodosilinea sp.]
MPQAQAAEPYEAGPIRQTHSPLSKENFNGGVDRAAVERQGHSSQQAPELETGSKPGLLSAIKNLIPGLSSKGSSEASPTSNIQAEKNPTLGRYTSQTSEN